MGVRDHDPIIIEEFKGLWDRGDPETCPSDHFIVADNVQYFESGVESRNPLTKWQVTTGTYLRTAQRIHNYVMQDGQSLLILTRGGTIYHMIGPSILHGPIATFPAASDFNMVSIAGRAYITPFHTLTDATGQTYQLGIPGESVYVYMGDGTPARKAGGAAPTNGGKSFLIAFNDTNDGVVTKGIHIIGVSFNGGTIQDVIQVLPTVDAPGNLKIQLTNIPIGPAGTNSRTIVMTHAIDPKNYSPFQAGFVYYTVETINDNTTVDRKIDVADATLTTVYVPGVTPNVTHQALAVTNMPDIGFCDAGFRIIAVLYETDTGYLTSPGPEVFAANTIIDVRKKMRVSNVPISPNAYVKKRHIVSTKVITDYNGDQKGYQFFFVPDGTIPNNTATFIDISYYDSDLVEDASHLIDNYESIPSGVNLSTYHGRMVVVGISTLPDPARTGRSTKEVPRPDNRSVALLSAPGEPEAISKVDGLIIAPLDGSPLTNAQEFRDLLYLFKKTRTYSYSDNFDEPATWQEEVLDQGIGAPVHGIGTVLDSGGVNTDFLVIVDWSGLMLFNGTYSRPELSFKIENFWMAMTRNGFNQMQIANDSIGKKLYIALPDPFRNFILYADYSVGLDAKNIKWAKWVFDAKITTLCLIETNKIILGADTVS
jgi:hypothetical protein